MLKPAIIIGILIIASCSAPKVISFHNEKIDFGNLSTFKVLHPTAIEDEMSEEMLKTQEIVEDRIVMDMKSRKYTKSDDPDLLVKYKVILSPKSDVRVNSSYPSSYYFYRYYYDPYYNTNTYNYIEGVIMIDMIDAISKKLAWQGSLDIKFNPRKENLKSVLLESIKSILTEYPYVAGKSKPVRQTEA